MSTNQILKGTSSTMQNNILECMYEVYREAIAKLVSETPFASIQADETTDVSCKSQMVIVLRYILADNSVWEVFVEVNDKTGVGLSNTMKQVLAPLNVNEKLVAQTYYRAEVMSGNVQCILTLLKDSVLKSYGLWETRKSWKGSCSLSRHPELHTEKTALSLLKSLYENNVQEALSETVFSNSSSPLRW